MKTPALICSSYGPPENLRIENIDLPDLGALEVRIEVSFVGMNFPDNLIIRGKDQYKPKLPISPCGELSGIIVAVGAAIEDLRIGDRVLAGGMVYNATRKIVQLPRQNVYQIPDNMPLEVAAGFCCVFGTAMHCLKDKARLKAGEQVAILGASGGVGMALIQVAKAMGGNVIACASTTQKLALCAELGADITLNYTKQDLKKGLKELSKGKGIDVICDPVGSNYSEEALRAMAWEGRFMVLGFTAGQIAKIPTNLLLLKGCSLVGVFWSTFSRIFPNRNRENIKIALKWYAEGQLQVPIHQIIPVKEYVSAFKKLGDRTVKGKLILNLKEL